MASTLPSSSLPSLRPPCLSLDCRATILDGPLLGSNSAPVFVIDIKGSAPTESVSSSSPSPSSSSPCSSSSSSSSSSNAKTGKDVLLVVDVSGSMCGTEPKLRKTIEEVGKSLSPSDRLSITLFNDKANLLHTLASVSSIESLRKTISSIKAMGGTSILAGLQASLDNLINTIKGVVPRDWENNFSKHFPTLPSSTSNKTQNNKSAWGTKGQKNDTKNEEKEQNNNNTNKEEKKGGYKEEARLAMVLLLSDGQDDAAKFLSPVIEKVLTLNDRQVIFHSFGFTTNHDHEVLQNVTTAGNCGAGLYYTFEKDSDIAPAVGDCLGSSNKINSYNVVVTASVVLPDGSEHPCPFFHSKPADPESGQYKEKLGAVGYDAQHTLVAVCDKYKFPAKLRVNAAYVNGETGEPTEQIVECDFPKESEGNNIITNTHIKTHLYRLKVGDALCRLIDPAAASIIPNLEEMHAMLIEEIEKVQQLEDQLSLADENILVALEQDLGEALEKLHGSSAGIMDQRLRGKFLQYAHEHLHQRSASTASRVRGTYATKEQLAMRLRFLAASDPTFKDKDAVAAEKAALDVDEYGLSPDQVERRKQADETLTCYVSLGTWREEEIGIGLLVKPRTMRERYKNLMPMVSIVPDYISAASFNVGVKATAQQSDAALDRDNDEDEDHTMVKSSTRGRINAWLPLYINASHWKSARTYAPSALSIIATQYNDMFKPVYALKVCSKLMIANVVKFTIEDQHASERSIQMYCDIHRLFLQMAAEYPDVLSTANAELKQFIEETKNRSRSKTPDLGDLILYLTITPDYSWENLKRSYIMESFRRGARFIRATAGHIPLQSLDCEEKLFDYWMKGTGGGKVTMFNILFLNVIARQADKTIDEIKEMYDSGWGLLPAEKLEALKRGYDEIMKVTQLPEVLEKLGMPLKKEALAELVLWAYENKDEGQVAWEDFPTQGGERHREWKERAELYKLVQSTPAPVIAPFVSHVFHRPPKFDGVASVISSEDLAEQASTIVLQECSCDRCKYRLEIQVKAIQWQQNNYEKKSSDTMEDEPSSSKRKHKEADSNSALKGNQTGPASMDGEHNMIDPARQIFVGRLPKAGRTKAQLHSEVLKAFRGFAKSVDIVVDKKTGKPKGYAFVELTRNAKRDQVLKLPVTVFDQEVVMDVIKGSGEDPAFLPKYLRV